MGKFVTLWFWQASRLDAEWFEAYSFSNDDREKPSLSRSPVKPTNDEPWSYTSLDDRGKLLVHVPKEHLPDAPSMWYLLVREYGEYPPKQTLIGFANDMYADGTVIEQQEFLKTGVELSSRAAAIRWGMGDPKIEQIYVAEQHRRKRVATKLINVADIVNVAGNWGGFIYGGDQVTELGSQLASSWTNSIRLIETKVKLPPMD